MDLVDILRRKISVLKDGEYLVGLKAVLLHIETAFRHLSRGQDSDDDTAFTDAIYRTNQAFEGSIKEAYRVLAGKDPEKKRPFDIETYLEEKKVFRTRVMKQLATYRTEWRNPSTHDYRLDFDENEAFLAIVSVSAFACLLLDQIAERLAFEGSQAEAKTAIGNVSTPLREPEVANLQVLVTRLLTEFCQIHTPSATSVGRPTEAQTTGALHGFLSLAAPDLRVDTQARLGDRSSLRADLLISRGQERLIVKLKRGRSPQSYRAGVAQLARYLIAADIQRGILLLVPDSPSAMHRIDVGVNGVEGAITVLVPQGTQLANEEAIPDASAPNAT